MKPSLFTGPKAPYLTGIITGQETADNDEYSHTLIINGHFILVWAYSA